MENRMPGPSLKMYFNDETEYHAVLKIAAQHDLTLPQYAHACIIKVTQEVIDAREALRAEEEAKQKAMSETIDEKVPDTLEAPTEDTSTTEVVDAENQQ